jgi:hypothetical protein
MARLAPIALLAFAVTLACGGPAAPTATPVSPAATSTPRAAATAPAPATTTAAPTSAPRPAQPTASAPGATSPTTDQTTNRAFQGYQSAWEKVDRFRVEMEFSQNGQTIGLYRLLVVRPDRMHLIVLDPGTGATLMEIIQIGNKSWNKIGGRWIESAAGGNTPVDTSQLWDPGKLSPDAAAPGTITYEQLPPETLDGVLCDRWKMTVEVPGMGKSETTTWIAQSDQLPRQMISEAPGGLRQVQRYSYNQDFDIQPPQ